MSKDEENEFIIEQESGTKIIVDDFGTLNFHLPEEVHVFKNFGVVIRDLVKFKRVHPNAQLPTKAKEFDACWDLYSCKHVVIGAKAFAKVDTGLQMEMPTYLEATIRPRSGMAAKHGVTVLNTPGTIDSGYRGNIMVILINHSDRTFYIKTGDRIAQMNFGLTQYVEFEEVDELNDSERGSDGFGSTGH